LADLGTDDFFAAREVAVLGRVADRVAHVGESAFVNEIDDELHLVTALEVSHLRWIAGGHQRLITGLDQLAKAAAQYRLLAEKIGFRLVFECRLDDRRPRAAERAGVGEPYFSRVPAGVLMDGEEARHAAAFLELAADEVPGPFRRDHEDVHALR